MELLWTLGAIAGIITLFLEIYIIFGINKANKTIHEISEDVDEIVHEENSVD
jgi:uncharacterized protein YoxC